MVVDLSTIHCEGYNHLWSTTFCPEGLNPERLAKSLAELEHLTRVFIGPVGSTLQDKNIKWIKGGAND